MLPEGNYNIISGKARQSASFLPSQVYDIDLRPSNSLSFDLTVKETGGNGLTITLQIQGEGDHNFDIRTDNLEVRVPSQKISLVQGRKQTMSFKCRILSGDESWVAVVLPDHDLSRRKEITGSFR